jgi:hypothetical protein
MKSKHADAKVPPCRTGRTKPRVASARVGAVCPERRRTDNTPEVMAALEARMEAFGQEIRKHNTRRKD